MSAPVRVLPLAGLAAALLLWTGCAAGNAHLKPAASAQAVAPDIAVAHQAGLAIRTEPDHWEGVPRDLANQYTPVKVILHNRGDKPVVVRYREFVLQAPNGKEFHAIPPLNTKGAVYESVGQPYAFAYPDTGFFWAPYYSDWYPGAMFWSGPFDWDDAYFRTYYPEWQVNLPTRDMINRALPEGVLKPGGTITGYLYFKKVPKSLKRVTFMANLHAPQNGRDVARLTIPFIVK